MNQIRTLGALKKSGYQPKTIKEELRANLVKKLQNKEQVFDGILGFDDTVLPDMERAILSRHNILLLGLRGQAKTRIARLLVHLLDEYIPVVEGSELNDDPLNPISRFAVDLIETHGDSTPISWLHRSERYVEKLATPDVSVADLIGDVDPIKAATLKLPYSDERVLHFGLVPRAHRSLFVINELPDLQARIQVSLFNILQEGDIQIRGFKLRLPLDIQFVFTANPEDYTNRGSIITPLKDRIESQILTHYPRTIETARQITQQEASLAPGQADMVQIPDLVEVLLEKISFSARESEFIDEKSGVSARLSISAYENLVSTAERRALINKEENTTTRITDFWGVVPAITGKVELVYEGEQEGAKTVAERLIKKAIKSLFPIYFPEIKKLEKQTDESPYDEIVSWFFNTEDDFELLEDYTNYQYQNELDKIKPLHQFLQEHQPNMSPDDAYFVKEFLLWGLVEFKKLSKYRFAEGTQFKDPYGNFISGL